MHVGKCVRLMLQYEQVFAQQGVDAAEVSADGPAREVSANVAATKRAWADCYRDGRAGRPGRPLGIEECNARAGVVVYPWRREYDRIRARLAFLERERLNLFKE